MGSKKKRLILGAHYHNPGYMVRGNVEFVNPGALMRRSIVNRDNPSVLLIDNNLNVKITYLKSAQKYEEVFKEKVEEEVDNNNIDDVNLALDLHKVNLEDSIKQVARNQNIPQNTVDYIINKLGEMKK